jgi:hypothetical protein
MSTHAPPQSVAAAPEREQLPYIPPFCVDPFPAHAAPNNAHANVSIVMVTARIGAPPSL